MSTKIKSNETIDSMMLAMIEHHAEFDYQLEGDFAEMKASMLTENITGVFDEIEGVGELYHLGLIDLQEKIRFYPIQYDIRITGDSKNQILTLAVDFVTFTFEDAVMFLAMFSAEDMQDAGIPTPSEVSLVFGKKAASFMPPASSVQ